VPELFFGGSGAGRGVCAPDVTLPAGPEAEARTAEPERGDADVDRGPAVRGDQFAHDAERLADAGERVGFRCTGA